MRKRMIMPAALLVAGFGIASAGADSISFDDTDFPPFAEVVAAPVAGASFGDDANVSLAQTFTVTNAFDAEAIYLAYETDPTTSTNWSMTVRIFAVTNVSAATLVADGADIYTGTFTFPNNGDTDSLARIDLTTPVPLSASVGTSGYAVQITEENGGDFNPGFEWLRPTSDVYAGGVMYEDGDIKTGGARDLTLAIAPTPPPTAYDDEYILETGTISTNVAAPGVLANDLTYDSAVLVSNISSGSLTFNADGSFDCSGLANGISTFTYAVVGGSVTSAPATVSLTVVLSEDPPVVVDDAFTMDYGQGDSNIVGNVLNNDTNNSLIYDLSALEDDYTVANGTLDVSANGDFTYTPTNGFAGVETFTYKAYTPLATSVVATVTLTVEDNEPTPDPALFDFNNGNPLDSAGVGATMTAEGITLTAVDMIGQDGTSAKDLEAANTMGSMQNDGLGIKSANNVGSWANDARDFNPGEKWIFSFDKDINFIDIDFSGWTDNGTEMTVSWSTYTNVFWGNYPGDTLVFPEDTFVPAGTEISLFMTSNNATTDFEARVPYLTVVEVLGGDVDPYAAWIVDQGLTAGVNDGYSDDPDGDDMDNLLEYALGGNALSNDTAGFLPDYEVLADGSTNYLNYVYRRRVDYADRGLTYEVGSTFNLVFEPLTNATFEAGTAPIDSAFEAVTNRVSMDDEDIQFMGLNVTID